MVAFLDTGSSISAINPATAAIVGSDPIKKPITMRSASGTFDVTHACIARIDVGLGEKDFFFYVIPTLTKNILLGNDFLAEVKISIHPASNAATCGSLQLPFCTPGGKPADSKSADLHLMEHVNYVRDNFPIDFNVEKEYVELLTQFNEIFDDKPSVAKVKPMRILTENHAPVKQKFRPLNPGKMKIATDYTNEMIDLGVFKDCDGPWASNYVFVDKPDGSKRLCGDYRQVNKLTVADAFPMPIVRDILTRMAKAKVFSTFDLAKGFLQIPVHPDDRCKTAIYTPLGLKQCRMMPFGLKNAPAVFQRVMEEVLGDMLFKYCLVYIDDVIIFSDNETEHLEHLTEFFKKIREYNLRINPKKIQPMKKAVKILGHIVTEGSYKPDPEKIEGIEKCPLPKTIKALQSYLGSINYYRPFIKDLAPMAKPLYAMTSVHSPKTVVWNSNAIEAFEATKKAIIGLVLHMPDLNGKFCIQTDASGTGIGAVLLTRIKKGDKTIKRKSEYAPCAFISRNLTGAECNYSVTEQECLAVVWAIEKFRAFVECRLFKVQTDHRALMWLMDLKDPKGRLARWVMRLQGYTFKIRFRPGSINYVPDTLSRNPLIKDDSKFLPEIFFCELLAVEIQTKDFDLFKEFTRDSIISAQKEDLFIAAVRQYIESEKLDNSLTTGEKSKIILAARDAFVLEDGLVVKYTNPANYASFEDDYNWERILAPTNLQENILRRFHDDTVSGHLGIDQTYDSVQKRFYWPNMFSAIRNYVRSCHTCQTCRANNQKPSGLMKASELTLPWEKVSIDLIGPLPKTKKGHEYILVIIDTASNWVEAFPMRQSSATAEGCADNCLSVFSRWGFPNRIVSDNGPQFASQLWISIMNKLKIRVVFTTPYHPQANPVERKNKDAKSYLRKYVTDNHKVWDEYLYFMLFALRCAKVKSTGLTPAQVCLGRNLTSPIDLFLPDSNFRPSEGKNIRDYANKIEHRIKNAIHYLLANRELAGIENKLYYDPHHKKSEFNEGDWVTLEAHPLSSKAKGVAASLMPKREGPFIIKRKINPLNYELGDVNSNLPITFAHVVQLKRYYDRPNQPVITDKNVTNVPKAAPNTNRLGLGKARGRPKGSPAIGIPPVPVVRTAGPVTRQQTANQKE